MKPEWRKVACGAGWYLIAVQANRPMEECQLQFMENGADVPYVDGLSFGWMYGPIPGYPTVNHGIIGQ